MIETHVVNALLTDNIKHEFPYRILTFINGLVAPTFLFCAGFAFAITLHRKWQEYVTFQHSLWKYLIRLLFILVVGYSLHLPVFSLKQLLSLTDSAVWRPFYQADILQTIAVTLMLAVVMVVILRQQNRFFILSGMLTLFIIIAAPIIRELDYSNVPVWLSPYFTLQVTSQFPLLPWSAFLLSGMLIGYWYISAHERGRERVAMNRYLLFALCGVLLSLLAEVIPVTVYPNHNFWRASPEFFFVRLGIVVLLMYVLWRREQHQQQTGRSYLSLFGQESLLVYTVHLLVVYGYTYEFSFVRMFGPTMNYLECLGLFAALTLAMYILAYVWHWMKGRNKRYAMYLQYAILGGIVLMFVVK